MLRRWFRRNRPQEKLAADLRAGRSITIVLPIEEAEVSGMDVIERLQRNYGLTLRWTREDDNDFVTYLIWAEPEDG